MIPPIPIPNDATCQEASFLSRKHYIPCGAPATTIIYHEKDGRGYFMCDPCADHNLRHRGGKLLSKNAKSALRSGEYDQCSRQEVPQEQIPAKNKRGMRAKPQLKR